MKIIGGLIILTFTIPVINRIPSDFFYGFSDADAVLMLIISIILLLISIYGIYKGLKTKS